MRCLFNLGKQAIALEEPVLGQVLRAVNGVTPSSLPPFAAVPVRPAGA